jgi:hypothetical protein
MELDEILNGHQAATEFKGRFNRQAEILPFALKEAVKQRANGRRNRLPETSNNRWIEELSLANSASALNSRASSV